MENCPICLNNIDNFNKKNLNCICKKNYHKDCINQWLKYKNTCPCCRSIIYNNNGIFSNDPIRFFFIFYCFLWFLIGSFHLKDSNYNRNYNEFLLEDIDDI